MEIQIIKFSLTEAESTQALPVMISAIAGNPPSDFGSFTDLNPFQEEPPDNFQEPFRALPETPPPVEPASPMPEGIVRIAAPTGTPKLAKSMVWDGRAKRYVRRAFAGRLSLWARSLGASLSGGVQRHPALSAIAVGLLLGSMLFWLLARTGLTAQFVESFRAGRLAEVVPKEGTPAAPAPEPGDASSKAGLYGKQPPMQAGAVEE